MSATVAAPFRVLAIDDEKDMLEVIRLTLGPHFEVLTLSNPFDTYELIDLFQPDLIMMDVMMPKITGFQLLELFQKNAKTKSLPVMILSAKTANHEIRHGYTLGAKLYLTKPFDPERLLKNVRTFFETSERYAPTKLHPFDAVQMQLRLKNCYKGGSASLVGPEHVSGPVPGRPVVGNAHFRERLDQ